MNRRLLRETLNKKDLAEEMKISKILLEADRSISSISKALINNGYKKIGEGAFRKVYSKDDVSFVVKVCKNNSGILSNKKEISNLSPSSKSYNVKEILPKMYSYDRRFDPMWIICEKVLPISNASYDHLSKVFPTFNKIMLKGNYGKESNKKNKLIEIILNTLLYISKYDGILIDEIYTDVIKFIISKCKNKVDKPEDILAHSIKDIKRFIKAITFDNTTDIHKHNVGLRITDNPGIEDFVILDFDSKFTNKHKFNYLIDRWSFLSTQNQGIKKVPNQNQKIAFDFDLLTDTSSEHDSVETKGKMIGLNDEQIYNIKKIINQFNKKKSVTESVYDKLLEISYNKRKYSGSHPEESYQYGWPEFDESEFDKEGLTTWHKDRKLTKKYLKSIGLL